MPYNSKIANEMLVTPFDNKAGVEPKISNKLTPDEFCNNCYSKPRFERGIAEYKSEEAENIDDAKRKYEDVLVEIEEQKRKYGYFLQWLGDFTNSKVYTINGNSGTGKTTFVYHNSYFSDIEWVVLDIHEANSREDWISDISTDVEHFDSAQGKVYACIMNKICKLVFNGVDEEERFSISVAYDSLKKLIDGYNNFYKVRFPTGRKMMDKLCCAMTLEGTTLESTTIERVEACAEIFKTYIDGSIDKSGKKVIDVLDILLLILRCMYGDPDKKFIIVFDNFERFIENSEIYSRDVHEIRKSLADHLRNLNTTRNCHNNVFKFIMAIRDTTARMCGVTLDASDAEPSNLDISKWFDTEDIIQLKREWYEKNEIDISNSDLVQQITGDERKCADGSITGLKQFISPLFNNNKRLIMDFVGQMVESPKNREYLKIYEDCWNDNTTHSKFAARCIIRGLLLIQLEEKDNLFENLKTYSSLNETNGIGDARKILTILYNRSERFGETEMSLGSVLSELFGQNDIVRYINDRNNAQAIYTVSKIIYFLNSYNRRDNDWLQFIDLRYKCEETRDISVSNANDLNQLIKNETENFYVHLMPGGRVYLNYIVASFEFFALRYVKQYKPLYLLIPSLEEMRTCSSIDKLQCLKTIERVYAYAKRCIRHLKMHDRTQIFINGKASSGMYHFSRIKQAHFDYLYAFSAYISEKYINDSEIDYELKSKYGKLCDLIKIAADKYKKL